MPQTKDWKVKLEKTIESKCRKAVGENGLGIYDLSELVESITTLLHSELNRQKEEIALMIQSYFEEKMKPYKYFKENYKKLMELMEIQSEYKEGLNEMWQRIEEVKKLTRYSYDIIQSLKGERV